MKWLHHLLKGVSLTGALFVFQACYGVPQPPLLGEGGLAPMNFTLLSGKTGEPLPGIRILGSDVEQRDDLEELGTTGEDGRCHVEIPYTRNLKGPFLRFEDPDGVLAAKDTTLADLRERDIIVNLFPLE